MACGIIFGFKKPILFFPIEDLQSISYTSILQRTFNLVVDTDDNGSMEFSMLDQADYGGIDDYVKRHGLNDASMAAERQAKKYNINKKEEGTNGDGVAEEQTELAKAQAEAEAQLQEDEDEEEEDYDPGSEGESEGEGSSDDEQEQEQDVQD